MASSSAAKKPTLKTLGDWRAQHDPDVLVPNKMRKLLDQMVSEGPENWAYEGDFRERCGISTTQLARYRPEFDDHIVETTGRNPKRCWFALPEAAAVARQPADEDAQRALAARVKELSRGK